jgi:hypothetical protein
MHGYGRDYRRGGHFRGQGSGWSGRGYDAGSLAGGRGYDHGMGGGYAGWGGAGSMGTGYGGDRAMRRAIFGGADHFWGGGGYGADYYGGQSYQTWDGPADYGHLRPGESYAWPNANDRPGGGYGGGVVFGRYGGPEGSEFRPDFPAPRRHGGGSGSGTGWRRYGRDYR